jgi:hypothetical protein
MRQPPIFPASPAAGALSCARQPSPRRPAGVSALAHAPRQKTPRGAGGPVLLPPLSPGWCLLPDTAGRQGWSCSRLYELPNLSEAPAGALDDGTGGVLGAAWSTRRSSERGCSEGWSLCVERADLCGDPARSLVPCAAVTDHIHTSRA